MNFVVNEGDSTDSLKRRRSVDYNGITSPVLSKRPSPYHSDFSNSSWVEMETLIVPFVQIYPPTLATKQMFILRYLTLMGEYQEVKNSLSVSRITLVFKIVNFRFSDFRFSF